MSGSGAHEARLRLRGLCDCDGLYCLAEVSLLPESSRHGTVLMPAADRAPRAPGTVTPAGPAARPGAAPVWTRQHRIAARDGYDDRRNQPHCTLQ